MELRSYKLQELVAHDASVNCLSLGRKSGRVMVTGGDDKKVNLWAIDRDKCFMSLSGHTSPVKCVQFNQEEELVCSGSTAGSLKVWDLEKLKLIRTLNGHRDAIRCIDFHPFNEIVASGSADNSIKFWDSRKKSCLFTYQGHTECVNNVKFSPDGNWIASCGDDCSIKMWDIRIGRILKEFKSHNNTSVTCVEFHPHEFLLATASEDRAVKFYDLETFQLVSCESNVGSVRSLRFNPDGECLFAGMRDTLKVLGWEPNRVHDIVSVNWGRVYDISIANNKLIGASYHLTNVAAYVVDLGTIKPFNDRVAGQRTSVVGGGGSGGVNNPFAANQSVRKSFSKAESAAAYFRNRKRLTSLDGKTIDESTSGTDPEEESHVDITVLTDYNDVFKGQRQLTRTPPPPEPVPEPTNNKSPPPSKIENATQEPFLAPVVHQRLVSPMRTESLEALSLDDGIDNCKTKIVSPLKSPYSRSKSNLDQVYAGNNNKNSKKKKEEETVTRQNLLNATKSKTSLNLNAPGNRYNNLLQRQSSCKENSETKASTMPSARGEIKHSRSDASINRQTLNNSNGGGTSRTTTTTADKRNLSAMKTNSSPNVSRNERSQTKTAKPARTASPIIMLMPSRTATSRDSPDESPISDEYFPNELYKPVGLALEEFLPKSHSILLGDDKSQFPGMSEVEALGVLERGHESTMAILRVRARNLKLIHTEYRNTNDLKATAEAAVSLSDPSVIVDLLSLINNKHALWNLDICVVLLPEVEKLLDSKFEKYLTTACNAVALVLRHFGAVIKENAYSPSGTFGVDLSREARYDKAVKCQETLLRIRAFVERKQFAASKKGNLPNVLKEIQALMKNID